MANTDNEPLLRLRRNYSANERYNLLLQEFNKLKNETKDDAANLKSLRRIYASLEKEHAELQKMLEGRGVISEKTYLQVLNKNRKLQAALDKLKEEHFDLIREKNREEAEKVRKELELLKM